MYENLSKNQRYRQFWGWTVAAFVFLVSQILVYIITTHVFIINDKQIQTIVGISISSPITAGVSLYIYRKFLVNILPDVV